MFIVIPLRYIRPNVAIIDVGIDTPITNEVFQSLRKIRRTITAINALWKAVDVTLLNDNLM